MFLVPFFSLVLLARLPENECYAQSLCPSKFLRSVWVPKKRREVNLVHEDFGGRSIHSLVSPLRSCGLVPGRRAIIRTDGRTRAQTPTPTNRERLLCRGTVLSVRVRPSVRRSVQASDRATWPPNRRPTNQPSLHSNVVLYAVKQEDEKGDGRGGETDGRGRKGREDGKG